MICSSGFTRQSSFGTRLASFVPEPVSPALLFKKGRTVARGSSLLRFFVSIEKGLKTPIARHLGQFAFSSSQTSSFCSQKNEKGLLLFSDRLQYRRSAVLRRRNSSWMPPNVNSGEGGARQSTEEQMFDEQTLQSELESAINEEDYARAAKLRNNLQRLHEDSKASVLSANARFYNAFRNGDLAAMRSIWAKEDHVYVVHPGAGRISGYELVTDSWEIVCGADHEFPIQIDLKNVEVHVRGNVGYVTCMEVVKTRGSSWGKQVATNVFERIDAQWFMCIHHASHIEE